MRFREIRLTVGLLASATFAVLALMPAGCAGPPDSPSSSASAPQTASQGIARLAAPFRDYRLNTRRPGGGSCEEGSTSASPLRYVESLEYIDAPPVTFGMDGDCIREIRTDYAMRDGRFEHAVSLASQRLGPPDGEDRAVCTASGVEIRAVFWDQPEGRFQVVRMGFETQPEFVLRPSGAPSTYDRLCEGGIER